MKNQQRLTLLNQEEIHILYSLPEFTDIERQHYFSLPELILKQLKLKEHNYNKTSTKLYFILQFGYFKAKNLFFKLQYKDLEADISFIMKNYMPNDKLPKNLPTNKQRAKIKRNILAYFGFQNKVHATNNLILKRTSAFIKSTIIPHAVCIDVINYLREQKTILPSYSGLQDIIGEGLKKEEIRLTRITKKHLTKKITKAINALLKIEDVFYKITELKFDPKCFKKQEMSIEMDKLETCILVFNFSKTFQEKILNIMLIWQSCTLLIDYENFRLDYLLFT